MAKRHKGLDASQVLRVRSVSRPTASPLPQIPTQDLVLASIEVCLETEHGTGAVTQARVLLREISTGTSAFGGAKARREIAGRPVAPYGRLLATRPGEYLPLDTTRAPACSRLTRVWPGTSG